MIGIHRCFFSSSKGYRVIASDQRGHGRSTQTYGGHDMDHYADDLKAVTDHLNLKDAIHVGHSTGGEGGAYLQIAPPEFAARSAHDQERVRPGAGQRRPRAPG